MKITQKYLILPLVTLSTSVLAADPLSLGDNIALVSEQFLTSDNVGTIGTGITLVGLGIALFKVIQVMFGGSSWAEHAKAIFGGLVVAILGTKLYTLLAALGAVPPIV